MPPRDPAIERRYAWLIFITLWCCYGYFFPKWAEWNQNSRMDLTLAVVEQGGIAIDDYYNNTGDYAVHGGHIYTDKAPGLSFLGVPVYAAFAWVTDTAVGTAVLDRASRSGALAATLSSEGTGLVDDKVRFAAALHATTLWTVSLASAALAAGLFVFLRRLGLDTRERFALALAYGLATIAFPYSTVFYGHQLAAALVFGMFAVIASVRRSEHSERALWAAGALGGLAVLVDFPSLVLVLLLVVYAMSTLAPLRTLIRIGVAGAPFAIVLGAYNAAAFGSPFSSSYRYLGRFPEISNSGVLGFGAPSLDALVGITVSPYRGLFYYVPFLIVAVPGIVALARRPGWRTEARLIAAILAADLLVVACWYDWRGGFAIGPRNLLTIVPFLMVGVGAALTAWRDVRWAVIGFWSLVGISFGIVWLASVSGQAFAPITIGRPLTELFWPRFLSGDIARNAGMALGLPSWVSLFPPLAGIAVSLWLGLKRWPAAAGRLA